MDALYGREVQFFLRRSGTSWVLLESLHGASKSLPLASRRDCRSEIHETVI